MGMADLIITKPGGGSTAEVAYRGTPVVFDAANGMLHWEGFTVKQFEEKGRGVRLEESSMKALQNACTRAMSLGRSTVIAQDSTNRLLDTGVRVNTEVNRLMQTRCYRCEVFPS